jgi:hypothetical protein
MTGNTADKGTTIFGYIQKTTAPVKKRGCLDGDGSIS